MALTKDRYSENFASGWQLPLKVAGKTQIFKGGFVCTSERGYLVPAANKPGYRFIGIARDGCDNRLGDDGARSVIVVTQGSVEMDTIVPVSQDCVGRACHCIDDVTVDIATSYSVLCGVIVNIINSQRVRVRFDAITSALRGV